MTDLSFHPVRSVHGARCAIVPRTVKGTVWLSDKIILLVELDKPVTLPLDGASELDAMARGDGLQIEGL